LAEPSLDVYAAAARSFAIGHASVKSACSSRSSDAKSLGSSVYPSLQLAYHLCRSARSFRIGRSKHSLDFRSSFPASGALEYSRRYLECSDSGSRIEYSSLYTTNDNSGRVHITVAITTIVASVNGKMVCKCV
jgi:hypothetical protein